MLSETRLNEYVNDITDAWLTKNKEQSIKDQLKNIIESAERRGANQRQSPDSKDQRIKELEESLEGYKDQMLNDLICKDDLKETIATLTAQIKEMRKSIKYAVCMLDLDEYIHVEDILDATLAKYPKV